MAGIFVFFLKQGAKVLYIPYIPKFATYFSAFLPLFAVYFSRGGVKLNIVPAFMSVCFSALYNLLCWKYVVQHILVSFLHFLREMYGWSVSSYMQYIYKLRSDVLYGCLVCPFFGDSASVFFLCGIVFSSFEIGLFRSALVSSFYGVLTLYDWVQYPM